MKKKIIILGGGLSGLSAAEILSKNFDVQLFEKENFLGGLAGNFEQRGRMIPRYYHHIIKSNNCTQNYLSRFGANELDWKKIDVAIGVNGKLTTINSMRELMKFKYLKFNEKMRFGLFGIYSLFLMNPNKIPDSMGADEWLNKYAGKSVTKKIFYNLYSRNKFNLPLNQISAKQFANRLHEKEVRDYFSFPKNGYQSVIDGLRREILENQGKIKTEANLQEINLEEKYIVESEVKKSYDVLLSTIPLKEFIKISKGLGEDYKTQISKIKYCPAVGLCFGTENFLNRKNYWINLFGERIHIVMQHSLLCDDYGDKINWCLRYGGSEEDLELNDDEIRELYLKDVKKYFPNAKIKWSKVFKTEFGEPIYDINYSKYMPEYKTPVNGLYFGGIQLTHPKIRNMNVALESGIFVAKKIMEDIT